jgi:predicted  nucleic acid-binding Zn-ribbon protein
MVWTILGLLCVMATKFLTAVRLRGLKAKLEAIQPEIDEVRYKVAEAEDSYDTLKLKVEEKEKLLTNLKDVVRNLEDSLKQPAEDRESYERVQLMEAESGA